MKYYSTNGKTQMVTLAEAVVKGLAADRGLFMPEHIGKMPKAFFNNISSMSLQEMSFAVAYMLFGDDIDSDDLKHIVSDTLNFDIPLVKVDDQRY